MQLARLICASLVPLLASAANAGSVSSGHISNLGRPPAIINVPRAELEIFSSDHVHAAWSGKGDSETSIDLCVTSTTGRFRLQVISQSGGKMSGQDKIPYEISFRDSSGGEHTQPFANNAVLTFEGMSRANSDCSEGPNATLKIATREKQMLGAMSGNYFDRLTMSASPL